MDRVEINNGKSCFLWEDLWGNEILMHKFPELFSFKKKKQIILAEGMAQTPLHNLFPFTSISTGSWPNASVAKYSRGGFPQ
jgi:hypothetical protein